MCSSVCVLPGCTWVLMHVFARVWDLRYHPQEHHPIIKTGFLISLEPTSPSRLAGGVVHSWLLTSENPGWTPSCLEFVRSFWLSNSIPHAPYGPNHLPSPVLMELISTNTKSNYGLSVNCHKCTINILTKLWRLLRFNVKIFTDTLETCIRYIWFCI